METSLPAFLTLPPDAPRRPAAVRTSFSVPADAKGAVLRVTGLGLYRAFLDGARLGDAYLTPGCNDYDGYVRYETIDVTPLLSPGARQTLSVLLGDGWYRGRYGIDKPPEAGGCVWGDSCLLSAVLTAETDDGTILLASTGSPASWDAVTGPLVSADIYDGEVWDYTRPETVLGPCVSAAGRLPHAVVPFFGAPIRARDVLFPTILHTPAGETVLDFGVNLAGFVRVTGILPAGTTLTLSHGETLQNGCFCDANLRTARAQAAYTGDGCRRVMEPHFSYFGFRYVSVDGIDEPTFEGLAFEAVVLSSAGAPTYDFSSDRGDIVRIADNTWNSLRANFMDIPTDCPQRDERLGWTADARVFAPTACLMTDCRVFFSKYLSDMRLEQTERYGGDIPMYVPSLCGEAAPGGAGWADAAVLLPWSLYEAYGDGAQLARDYPLMRDYADCLLSREQGRGLITGAFTFGDWLAGDGLSPASRAGGTDTDYITNAFLYRALTVAASVARVLHREADAARFTAAADRVRTAVRDAFFAPSGRLSVRTQTACVLALAFGLYRDRQTTLRDLRDVLDRSLGVMKTGFLGTPLLLPTLFEACFDRDAWRILTSRACPGWLYAVDRGATTIWERWNSLDEGGGLTGTAMNSLNHYAYGSVCEALFGYVCGLRAAAPGWRRVTVDPHPAWQMSRAALTLETAAGRCAVSWETDGDGVVTLSGSLPAGVPADVTLPDGQHFTGVTGQFSYRTKPVRRLVRPYDADTPFVDLLSDPAAEAVLRTCVPQAYRLLAGDDVDFRMHTPRLLPTLPMFGVTRTDYEKLTAALTQTAPTREPGKEKRYDTRCYF